MNGAHLLFIIILMAAFIKFVFRFFDLENENKQLKEKLGRN